MRLGLQMYARILKGRPLIEKENSFAAVRLILCAPAVYILSYTDQELESWTEIDLMFNL